jgi:Tol biopolymer transport system component
MRRFEHEARVLSALDHPNLLSIFDVGEQQGVQYLVSEFLDGHSLRDLITEGPLPQRKVKEYALQIASGLAAAHDKGIIHRDLKPENVFITRDERVKILDFGLAKQARAASATTEGATVTKATNAGMIMGTAGYMSPEQVRGQPLDHRTDIFSFGVMLYEMVCGNRPFKGESTVETMNAILKEDPPDLGSNVLHTPPGMDRIVRRCLEKSPARRFQSASDLAFAIEALSEISSSGTSHTADEPKPGVSRKLIAGLSTAAALAAAFFLGGRFLRPQPPTFRQLIAGRGYISSARFTPEGENVVYGAVWNGKPRQVFTMRVDGLASRSLDLPPAEVLGVSSTGEMAISLGHHNIYNWMTMGTLGQVHLSGGAPRALVDNICDGDISPDGTQFAVVRCTGKQQALEYPIGKVLYRTAGWISHPRISPDGNTIAFLDHPIVGDDWGWVSIADRSGQARRLTRDWSGEKALAWTPSGDEIWFSASVGNEPAELRAVTPRGKDRVILATISELWLRDIAKNGDVLLASARQSSDISVRMVGQDTDHLLDLPDENAFPAGLSDDGSVFALEFSGIGGGGDYSTYFLRADTPEPVRLGPGDASSVSPDGKWVMAFLPSSASKIILYPTGTGEPHTFDIHPIRVLSNRATWSHDGKAFLFDASQEGKPSRAYVLEVATGKTQPVTPEGTSDGLLSPDGHEIVARNQDGFALYSMGASSGQPVRGLDPNEVPVQWDESSTKLFVWDRQFPAHVSLLDPHSGVRRHWLDITPADTAGLLYGNLNITPNGRFYACRFRRVYTNLFLAQGLK